MNLLPKSKLHWRILPLLLGVPVAALLLLALVMLLALLRLGEEDVRSDREIGTGVLQLSEKALDSLATKEMLSIAVERAEFFDSQLKRVAAEMHGLAAYAEKIQDRKRPVAAEGAYSVGEDPENPDGMPVPHYHLAPDAPPEAVKDNLEWSASLEDLCTPILSMDPDIASIVVGTQDGFYREFPWPEGIPPDFDPRNRPWWQRTTASGDAGWTEPYVSATTGGNLEVCFSAPIYDREHKLYGVIGATAPITNLAGHTMTGTVETLGKACLVDEKMRIIVGTAENSQGDFQDASVGKQFMIDALPAEMERMKTDLISGKSGIIRNTYQGKEMIVAYSPIAATHWIFLLTVPFEQIREPVRQFAVTINSLVDRVVTSDTRLIWNFLTWSAGISLVMIVLIAFIVAMTAQRIVNPILDLVQGIRVIGSGDLDHRLNIHTGDELEELAHTVNKMADDLKVYIQDLQTSTAAQERLRSEMKIATDIQAALLPRIFPPFPDRPEFDIFATMIPAKQVGGDFYDFFFIDEKKFCILIGDVSDKGIPAALYMMVIKTLLKKEAMDSGTPDEILFRVNNYLAYDNPLSMFVTIFLAILDLETGELLYSNAGHNPPLLCTESGGFQYIELPPGMVAGPMAGLPFVTKSLVLQPGDMVYLYTDGVSEAMNTAYELFGEKRLLECLSNQPTLTPRDIIQSVARDFHSHDGDAPQSDVITMLAIKFNSRKGS